MAAAGNVLTLAVTLALFWAIGAGVGRLADRWPHFFPEPEAAAWRVALHRIAVGFFTTLVLSAVATVLAALLLSLGLFG